MTTPADARFDLEVVNVRTGRVTRLGLRPMTVQQATTHRSKMHDYAWRRIRLVEIDTQSSASRQHYIDTGFYLAAGELHEDATP